MFTGLIESVGTITAAEPVPGGRRLAIETSLAPHLREGDSLATSGVCLTVVRQTGGVVEVEVSPETLSVTTLGGVAPGDRVNLERPLRPDDRLGGHFVQGHVDGVGRLAAIHEEHGFRRLVIEYPEALGALLIPRGSIAVDGISLTIAALRAREFEVQIVPHTRAHTTLASCRAGDRLNLECDMLGKYVVRALQLAGQTPAPADRGDGSKVPLGREPAGRTGS